ncbi:TonB-dependent receptor [Flavobacterium algicola]|uniref:TonB-dependent receptor n=1 Tax=Flavobacterium algicola TaxID=556529 RepID=UPI001EFD593C|nr:TonB-dependent receptor [Flavobacterium algicola]MCG9792536.1 TonB-dependent receptor [Flavobacterium algicola]
MKKALLAAIKLLLTITCLAQQPNYGSIKGQIRTKDGKVAEGVSIFIKELNRTTIANNDGVFKLNTIPEGTHTLIVTLVGFTDIEKTVVVKANEITQVDLQLAISNTELNQVVILSNKSAFKTNRVSSTLRLQSSIIEIPQNIQVITGKLINDQQIFDMLEGVTRNVSGVTRNEHWDNYANIFMRGSRVAPFRNGMNVSTTWGPLTEDMSMVERIEFVKGPAGFMLSNGSSSGLYNVVTKKPSGRTKGEASLTLGSFDMYRATIDLDGKLTDDGKLLYRFNAMGQAKNSFRDFDYNNRYTIAPVLKYLVDDNTSVTLEYTHQFSQVNMIGTNYVFSKKGYADLDRNFTTGEANFAPTNMNDKSLLTILEHKFDDNWKFTGQAAYFNYTQVGMSMWPDGITGDEENIMARRVYLSEDYATAKTGQFFINGEEKTGSVNHKILAGFDMSDKINYYDWTQSALISDLDIYNPVYGTVSAEEMPVFDRSIDIKVRGLQYKNAYNAFYLQDELGFFDEKLRLTLAGRYTTIKTSTIYSGEFKASKFTPRIGLSYSINPNTSVYAMRDQSFTENYGTDWEGKSFDPLSGTNIEVGFKRDWLNGKWNSVFALYQITNDNILTADQEHSIGTQQFSKQSGQQKVRGFEADIRGEIAPNLDVIINYAFTEAKVSKDSDPLLIGSQVSGTSKHVQNAWLNYKIDNGSLNGLGISLGYQYQVDRKPWFASDSAIQLPDYFRLDGGLTYTKNKMTFNLIVNNILDKYLYSGGYYTYNETYYWQAEAGTNFRLSVGYKF